MSTDNLNPQAPTFLIAVYERAMHRYGAEVSPVMIVGEQYGDDPLSCLLEVLQEHGYPIEHTDEHGSPSDAIACPGKPGDVEIWSRPGSPTVVLHVLTGIGRPASPLEWSFDPTATSGTISGFDCGGCVFMQGEEASDFDDAVDRCSTDQEVQDLLSQYESIAQ